MAVEVERLITLLEARITGYERELKKSVAVANRSAKQIETRFGAMNKALIRSFGAFGVALAPAALATFVTHSIEAADAIGKTADKVGLSVEALQELRYAADLSGVGVRTLDMAMQRLTRRVGEAAQGKGELVGTLKQYAIAVTDSEGRTRRTEDVLGDLAEAVRGADSDAERLRIAFKAFDSEGAALVNMLRGGRAGLAQMRAEAQRLGFVLDDSMVRQAERANDQLMRMGGAVGANLTRMALSLAPTIIRMGNAFAEAAPKIRGFVESMLPASLVGVAELDRRIAEIDERIRETTGRPQTLGGKLFDAGGSRADVLKGLAKQRADLVALRAEAARAEAAIDLGLNAPAADPGAAEARAEAVAKVVKALEEERAQLGLNARAREILAAQQKAGVEAASAEGKRIARMAAEVYDLRTGYEDLESYERRLIDAELERGLAADRIVEGTAEEISANQRLIAALEQSEAEYERVAALLEILNQYRAAGIEMTPDEIAAAEKVAEKLGEQRKKLDDLKDSAESAKKLGADLGMTFASAFEDAIIEGKRFSDVLKGLAQDVARLILRQTITAPLAAGISSGLTSLFGSMGFASGTGRAPPGLAWVGEQGPELVSFRGGEAVYPAGLSARIAAAARSPGQPSVLAGAAGRGGDTYFIDARGADRAGLAALERQIRAVDGSIERRAVAAWGAASRRNRRGAQA